jgi:ATP-dependent Lon protease
MTITGNLGTVMKESATIALEYIKANAKLMGLNLRLYLIIIFIYMYRKEQHLKTA